MTEEKEIKPLRLCDLDKIVNKLGDYDMDVLDMVDNPCTHDGTYEEYCTEHDYIVEKLNKIEQRLNYNLKTFCDNKEVNDYVYVCLCWLDYVRTDLKTLENKIHEDVIGQEEAVKKCELDFARKNHKKLLEHYVRCVNVMKDCGFVSEAV